MTTVTISPKYQVVIPSVVRKSFGFHPGEKLHMFPYEGRIELIPAKTIKQLRGFAKGIDTRVDREGDRV
ncbi:MAG: AbrB/MazE/SpoVT family DNA-binding domain-containing protein [Candidatus Omnitrophica bacterium]|nr:AbrB/MazE/SpoVT family DNA-binding domain-containing protein [Candidatus Omnitrophota bacterium]